jgi:hypothetical protein
MNEAIPKISYANAELKAKCSSPPDTRNSGFFQNSKPLGLELATKTRHQRMSSLVSDQLSEHLE